MMQNKRNRSKMWSFLILCITGLNICLTDGGANSTQMHYAKLTVDSNVVKKLKAILNPFSADVNGIFVSVGEPKKSTICSQKNSTAENCTCEPHFKWTDNVRRSHNCAQQSCVFPLNAGHKCISDSTVVITGSISVKSGTIDGDKMDISQCLKTGTPEYFTCNDAVLKKLKTIYSTLRGFDILKIIKYSVGSIIIDFKMYIADQVNTETLSNLSKEAATNLTGVAHLQTTGVVTLTMPENPVKYYSTHSIKCTSYEDLKINPEWRLKQKDDKVITNGTELSMTPEPGNSTITLTHITELWQGEYSCTYLQQEDLYTISHIARAKLNVSLLPNIEISLKPAFPRCLNESTVLNIKGFCEVEKSYEDYTVGWSNNGSNNVKVLFANPVPISGEKVVYEMQGTVECKPNQLTELMCTFTNRLSQTRNASININFIRDNRFCAAQGDWPDTIAGYTAELKCLNKDGRRRRECSNDITPVWKPERVECVNKVVSNLLKSANIVDIGLGNLDENAAEVFAGLKNVTNDINNINTHSNMNASVKVLAVLGDKFTRAGKDLQNESTVNNLLESSSNMLDSENSWTANDSTVAETYLTSVETLIKLTNLTAGKQKMNLEVVTRSCTSESTCINNVFNVTVNFKGSSNHNIKTTGFKLLQNYLPHNDTHKPNSIVVSTTADNQTDKNTVNIDIDFDLILERPRNVKLQCVFWDVNASRWSDFGCQWKGPANDDPNKQRCSCNHLSSFAILMAKNPEEIAGMTEITYAGLSISIVSLVTSLVIELIVWSTVVKTNILHLRHTAHVNISLNLLLADCCFLASSDPLALSEGLCRTFVVVKHFCYLAMFFWMLCLSVTLLHQAVFLFHNVSKKNYLRFSLLMGYASPLLIVAITFLINEGGAEGMYYSKETCWLIYKGLFNGSIHTFYLPLGIIIFVNMFSMLVVIMKLLDHPKNVGTSQEKEKTAAKTVVRSVILLTPIFGITWIFGFGVTFFDLTSGPVAYAANYAFALLNAFQGFFILVTTCLGDRLTREALMNRFQKKAPASISESSTSKTDTTWKK